MGWQLTGLGVQRKIEEELQEIEESLDNLYKESVPFGDIEKRQQESYLVGVIVGLNKALEIIKE